MKVPGAQVFARAAHVASAKLDGEIVLFNEQSETLHLLDPLASLVWECLDGEATVAELVEDFSAVFQVDPERAQDDLRRLFASLVEDGTVEELR